MSEPIIVVREGHKRECASNLRIIITQTATTGCTPVPFDMPTEGVFVNLPPCDCGSESLRSRLAEAEKALGWVSVLERMPTKQEIEVNGKWWLVANDKTGRRDVAMLVQGNDFMGHGLQFKDVTHWQPLAKPPEARAALTPSEEK